MPLNFMSLLEDAKTAGQKKAAAAVPDMQTASQFASTQTPAPAPTLHSSYGATGVYTPNQTATVTPSATNPSRSTVNNISLAPTAPAVTTSRTPAVIGTKYAANVTGLSSTKPGAPTAGAASKVAQTAQPKADAQWTAIEGLLGSALPNRLADINAQTSLNERYANEKNAASGGSALGGSAQAGQAQAQLTGAQLRSSAIQENTHEQIAARANYLGQLMAQAQQQMQLATSAEEARKAREAYLKAQEMANETGVMQSLALSGALPNDFDVTSYLNSGRI